MKRPAPSPGNVDRSEASPAATQAVPRPPRLSYGAPILLMILEVASLAVFSGLHLTGALRAEDSTGPATGAGITEAFICVVLLIGALSVMRSPEAGRRAALPALGFAIFGFIVGLTFTARGGQPVDLTYHAVTLPVLMLTAVLLLRATPVHR